MLCKNTAMLSNYTLREAERSPDRIPVEARFSAPVQTASVVHTSFYTTGTPTQLRV
jgi:hypothetical protein